jgi:hypothetical protein
MSSNKKVYFRAVQLSQIILILSLKLAAELLVFLFLNNFWMDSNVRQPKAYFYDESNKPFISRTSLL